MVDAVLLEWDGVLADTRMARQRALLEALSREGVSSSASTCDECSRGRTVHASAVAALLRAGIVDHTLSALVALRAEQSFLTVLSTEGLMLTPGAVSFVGLAQRLSRVAIATCRCRAETDLVLRLAGLDGAASAVVTADDVDGDAPSARLYRRAIRHLARVRHVSPARSVAVVDSPAAISGARDAGLRILAVGAPPRDAVDADVAVDSLARLTRDDLERLSTAQRSERTA